MAFSFSQDLDDAVSRVRYGVGDTKAPGIFQDEIYEALLASAGNDEAAAIKAAAAGLAAWAANQPDQISANGKSLSWRERISQWNQIATGQAGSTQAAAPSASKGPQIGSIMAGRDYTVR